MAFGRPDKDQTYSNLDVQRTFGQCSTTIRANCIVSSNITTHTLNVTDQPLYQLPQSVPLNAGSITSGSNLSFNLLVGPPLQFNTVGDTFVIPNIIAPTTVPNLFIRVPLINNGVGPTNAVFRLTAGTVSSVATVLNDGVSPLIQQNIDLDITGQSIPFSLTIEVVSLDLNATASVFDCVILQL